MKQIEYLGFKEGLGMTGNMTLMKHDDRMSVEDLNKIVAWMRKKALKCPACGGQKLGVMFTENWRLWNCEECDEVFE